jgi:hypothetical protein
MTEEIEFFLKLRDASQMVVDACQEFLESKSPVKEPKPVACVSEQTFNILKFEPQEGAKIGSYDVAYKANNLEDKWTHAFNILRQSNATIKSRYHGQGYAYSYWLYGENKIYRQILKKKG